MFIAYSKAYVAGDATHPDLDDRDIQTYLTDRLSSQAKAADPNSGCSRTCVTSRSRPAATFGGASRGRSSCPGVDDAELGERLHVFAPAHEGWLIKKGQGGLKLWRRRWVTLAAGRLWYSAGPPVQKGDGGPERAVAIMEITPGIVILEGDEDDLTFVVLPGEARTAALAAKREQVGGWETVGEGAAGSGDEGSSGTTGSSSGDSPLRPAHQGWHFRAESLPEKAVWLRKLRRAVEIASWWSKLWLGRVLGQGGFSAVLEAVDKETGEKLAVKRLAVRSRMERDQAVAEADVLALVTETVRHPNLMSVKHIFVEGNTLWFMFPLCTGGDLLERIIAKGPFSEAKAAALLARLLDAMQALHRHGIVHLDIKPENIMFENVGAGQRATDADEEDPERMRLGDFGLSRVFGVLGEGEEGGHGVLDWDTLAKQRYLQQYDERINGTVGYMAPEVVLHKRYSPAADVWACGVVLHILLVGYSPFGRGCDLRETLARSVKGQFDFDPLHWGRISAGAKDLVRQMLVVDEEARITTAEALEHPWIIRHTRFTRSSSLVRGRSGSAGQVEAPAARPSEPVVMAEAIAREEAGSPSEHEVVSGPQQERPDVRRVIASTFPALFQQAQAAFGPSPREDRISEASVESSSAPCDGIRASASAASPSMVSEMTAEASVSCVQQQFAALEVN